jgi:hypothetical protein
MLKKRILAIVLILAGIAIIGVSGLGAARAFKHMEGNGPFNGNPPAANQTDVTAIRDWMTIPYVAEIYDVPPNVIFKNLEIPRDEKNKKMSLAQLNEKYYPDQPGIVLIQTQALMQALQKQEPPPPLPVIPTFPPTVMP